LQRMVETRATKRAKELLERDSKHCHPVLVVEKPILLEEWSFKHTYSRRGSFGHLEVK
jgi:hypothetical protein